MTTAKVPFATLVAELSDPASLVRRKAIKKIMRRRDEREQAVQHLAHLLTDPDYRVRTVAVRALAMLEDPQVFSFLKKAWHDQTVGIRLLTVEMIERRDGPQAENCLLPALGDPSEKVRLAALNALVRLQGSQALPSLLPLLRDKSDTLRENALARLVRLSEPPVMIPHLLHALTDRFEHVRQIAIMQLSELGQTHDQIVPSLLTLVAHPDDDVREAVFETLWRLHDPRSLTSLRETLHDPNSRIRTYAAVTVALLGDLQVRELLVAALSDADEQVRLFAADALEKLG